MLHSNYLKVKPPSSLWVWSDNITEGDIITDSPVCLWQTQEKTSTGWSLLWRTTRISWPQVTRVDQWRWSLARLQLLVVIMWLSSGGGLEAVGEPGHCHQISAVLEMFSGTAHQQQYEDSKHITPSLEPVRNPLTLSVRVSGSDVDGCCPLEWDTFGGSCYFYSKMSLTWHRARDWCNSHDSHLLILSSDKEWVRLSSPLSQ